MGTRGPKTNITEAVKGKLKKVLMGCCFAEWHS